MSQEILDQIAALIAEREGERSLRVQLSNDSQRHLDHALAAEARVAALEAALRGIIEIGKRDMSNPKYDGYFDAARAALARPTPTSREVINWIETGDPKRGVTGEPEPPAPGEGEEKV